MGLNKVMLIGHVGAEPDIKEAGGTKLAKFTLATSERWKDKASGERKEHTEWHNIVIWGKTADVVRDYVHKGSQLYVEGQIRTRSYDDEAGNKKYFTEVRADNIVLLDKKQREREPGQDDAETETW